MTTTTVEIDAFYPNGSPCVGREVSIRVVDGGAGASTGDGLLADQWTVRLDAAGHGEVDLPPNDELTPAGTFYRLSLIGASLVRDIEVPVTDETISWADASVQVSPVRRGPVSFTGTRFDRTVTVAEVTYLAMSVDAGNQQAYVDAKWVEAVADPFMPRTRTATVDTESPLVAEALALAYLDRYGTPGIEVGTVSLYPTREESEDLMDFIVQDLELERLVELTDTPPVGAAINAELNVQGEAWRWSGTDLVVDLNLARS